MLRCVGNILAGDDFFTNIAINAGVLQNLNELIFSKNKEIREEACFTLSNITAGSDYQIQLCLDLGIIDKLIEILLVDEYEVKK